MDTNKITASEMRALSMNNKEIRDLLLKIKAEALDGRTELYLQERSIKDSSKKELLTRGFDVEEGGRYNEINTLIKWSV